MSRAQCSSFSLVISIIMIFLSIVNLASLFVLTLSQTQKSPSPTSGPTVAPWSGCVNPNNPNQPEIIKIGSPHTICLTLGPGGNWAAGVEYGRYTWRPNADEYSRFHIPQCESNTKMLMYEYSNDCHFYILTHRYNHSLPTTHQESK